MASQLKQEYNDVKKNYDVYITRLSDAKKNLNEYNEQKQKVVDKKQEKKELYLQRQKSNTSEIEQCTNILKEEKKLLKIEDINSSIVELQNKIVDCDNKITDLVEQLTVNKTNLSFQKDRLQKIGTDSDVCPVCLRSIEEHDREHIDNEKNNLKTAILKLAEDINALLARTTRAKEIKNQINKTIQQKNTLLNETSIQLQNIINTKSRLKQLLEWQEELKHDINNLKSNETEFDELITNITNTIKTIQQGVDGINKQLYRLDIVKFIVSEEGVKSYIVNKLLELLNSKLYYYLKKLDSNSICVFNEYFEEEIVNEKNKICSYFNFSGAERKSIDLACLFAFSDIRRMQGGVSYNIAIYDELFDSSFDSKGIDLIIDILIERARLYDENSFVISHRRESLKAVTGDVIYLEKRDGITKRIEYSEI
jgi:DNA repair exonuclease SbcCD ATPase subunit